MPRSVSVSAIGGCSVDRLAILGDSSINSCGERRVVVRNGLYASNPKVLGKGDGSRSRHFGSKLDNLAAVECVM